MSMNSRAGLSPPADLEKGAAVLKAAEKEEEEVAVVDPWKAKVIKVSVDVLLVVYLLFSIGIDTMMVMVSGNWWDPWPGVLIISPIFITTLWLTPKMKDVYIQLYATKRSPGSE